MTATVSPEIVSACIRIEEPTVRPVVSYQRPIGRASMEDTQMFAERCVFIDRPCCHVGDGSCDRADGGSHHRRRSQAPPLEQRPDDSKPGPATHWISVPGAAIIAATAPAAAARLPASSARVWRSPPPRTVATITTPTATYAADRSITGSAVLWYGGSPYGYGGGYYGGGYRGW